MKILKNSYFKDIFNQALIVLIAQLIPVIFSPVISRLYDENAIAEITGMISLSSILLVFSSLKLENAIVLEKEESSAIDVLYLSIFIAIVYSVIVGGLIYLFEDIIIRTFKIDKIINVVPFYIISYSVLNVLNFWFVREKRFRLKAYSKLIETTIYIIFSVVLYCLIGNNTYGLAIGKALGVFIALIVLFNFLRINFHKVDLNKLKVLFLKYKEFPLYNAPSNFINVIGLQLLVLFIGANFSKENFGYFGLANMIVLIPISLVSQSVSSIFFQKISENYIQKNYKQIKKVFFETFLMLVAVAFPLFIILLIFSEDIFSKVFGENWLMSGQVSKRLSLVFLFQLVISPLGVLLIAINKVRLNAYWQYGRFFFVGVLMIFMLNYCKTPFLKFITYYTWAVAFVYSFYLVIIIVQVKKL